MLNLVKNCWSLGTFYRGEKGCVEVHTAVMFKGPIYSQVAKGSDLYKADKSTKLCVVVA